MFIVDMWSGRCRQEGYRYFSCGGDFWDKLVALGEEYGWRPMGTRPTEDSLKNWNEYGKFSGDYEVEDIMYTKMILAEDARAWASALEELLVDVQSGKVVCSRSVCGKIISDDDRKQAEYERLAVSLGEFLPGFIGFLRKGGFSFCWDD